MDSRLYNKQEKRQDRQPVWKGNLKVEKFSSEYFRKLANDLKFDLSDEEIEALKKDFLAVEKQVELFDTIDTDGVEPMIYPFETPTVFLREDEIVDVLDQDDALSNAADVRMGHVHVPKVVK
ncbi:Asp-tRNA(Asn)/Glu-tRNA(Gln) amidotransferase subunit GatC [Ileibacterium valens]|uniref:Asp-tRNA(Asn)/Glu-tRNA(Gln) amidotransferase subunit GatC n=1 Tax=Ileibacterium valens TaxID=1862668 RepID=UPI002694E994